MIIQRLFSKRDNRTENSNLSTNIGVGGVAGGGLILSKTKTGRLTGKVTRYHDAPAELIDKIKQEGLKASYSTDPNNLTNSVLTDIPMDKKAGLVYTAKRKKDAFGAGVTRSKIKGQIDDVGATKEILSGKSPNHKVLKLEFDYDDIKNMERVENPELKGSKNVKEWYEKLPKSKKDLMGLSEKFDDLSPIKKLEMKESYKSLGERTHVFKGDIDPSHIVGGKGYKKRGIKDIARYIKNNPKRFGKELSKVGVGTGLVGYGLYELNNSRNRRKRD